MNTLQETTSAVRRTSSPTLGPLGTISLSLFVGAAAGLASAGTRALDHALRPKILQVSWHYPWMMPLGLMLTAGAVGLALGVVSRSRRIDARIPLVVLGFLGTFELVLWIPAINLAARALLAAGLATLVARAATARWALSRTLVRRGLPVLLASVGLLAAACFSRLAWDSARARAALGPAPTGAPNVLFVVVDTARADHMGLHGYERPNTPRLEEHVRRRGGLVFERAYSSSPWSLPGHAVMFTGRWRHELDLGRTRPLPDSDRTLAEHLAALGYDTAGFVANLTYCPRTTGLEQGFHRYEDYPLALPVILASSRLGDETLKLTARLVNTILKRVPLPGRPLLAHESYLWKSAADVNAEALRWLDARPNPARPFLAFLNYFDLHNPYIVPEGFPHRFGRRPQSTADYLVLAPHRSVAPTDPGETRLIIDAYDNLVAYVDHQLGTLLDELDRRGLLDDTWVVVTSDHGEALGEHGLFGHAKGLYDPLLHVPLVLIPPRSHRLDDGPRRIALPVALRDLPATIAAAVGPESPSPFPGKSLLRHLETSDAPIEPCPEPILAEMGSLPHFVRGDKAVARYGYLRAVIHGPSKLIQRYREPSHEELYDLDADPGEANDRAAEPAARSTRDALRRVLESFHQDVSKSLLHRLDG